MIRLIYNSVGVFILLFVNSSNTLLHSQTLSALPNHECWWNELHVVTDSATNPVETISTVNYSLYPSATNDSLYDFSSNYVLSGHLKADTNRIWFQQVGMLQPSNAYPSSQANEWNLMYDFSLEVGDTAYWDEFNTNFMTPITIDSITVQLVENLPLKHFYLSNEDVIIEKIGSIHGFFRPYTIFFEFYSVLCSLEGTFETPNFPFIYYSNPEPFCDVVLNSVAAEMKHELVIYPNPVRDKLMLTSRDEMLSWNIIDYSGRKYANGFFDLSTEIDLNDLSSGSFVIEVQLLNGEIRRHMYIK